MAKKAKQQAAKNISHAYFGPQEITGYVAQPRSSSKVTVHDPADFADAFIEEWGSTYGTMAEQIAAEELINIPIARDFARMRGEGEISDEEAIKRGRMMQGGRGQLSPKTQRFIEESLKDPKEVAAKEIWKKQFEKKGVPYDVWKEKTQPRLRQGLPVPTDKEGKYINPQDYLPLPPEGEE